jgi:four helix bundle protein
MVKLEVRGLALEAIELLRPIVARIKKHDRSLARQIADAANSSVLNTGEGALSDPGTRRSRYQSAAGSANEVRVGVLAAVRWGYVTQGASAVARFACHASRNCTPTPNTSSTGTICSAVQFTSAPRCSRIAPTLPNNGL